MKRPGSSFGFFVTLILGLAFCFWPIKGAMVDAGFVVYPSPVTTGNAGTTTLLIDASGEKVAALFRVYKAGDIRKLTFRLITVTTGQTLKFSLQDVDLTTGNPDGTVDQSCTVTVADTDDNTFKTCTLGADRTVAVGDYLAAVAEFDATVGNLQIGVTVSQLYNNVFADHFTASWAKQNRAPLVAVEYSDASYQVIPGVLPSVGGSTAFSSSSTPDERGNVFQLNFKYEVVGLMYGTAITATSDVDLVLYDSASTVLGTASIDGNSVVSTGDMYIGFFTPVTVNADTLVRGVVKPTTTNNTTLGLLDAHTATALGQLAGGQDIYRTTRTDAGVWTDTTTGREHVYLVISKFDDGAGGGTNVLHAPVISTSLRDPGFIRGRIILQQQLALAGMRLAK